MTDISDKAVGEPAAFIWLTEHEMRELAMPASPNRTVTAWRQPQDSAGRALCPLYAAPPVSLDPALRDALAEIRTLASNGVANDVLQMASTLNRISDAVTAALAAAQPGQGGSDV